MEIKELQFSNEEIKRYAVFIDDATGRFVSFLIVIEGMEIEMILLDDNNELIRNKMSRNIERIRSNSDQKDAMSLNERDYVKLGIGQVLLTMIYRYDQAEEHTMLYEYVIRAFLISHKCRNVGCAGFSYLKCKGCMTTHYCNLTCQKEDFGRHRKDCNTLARNYKIESWGPKRIEELINISTETSENVISLSDFMKKTPFKLFCRNIKQMTGKEIASMLEFSPFKMKSSVVKRIVYQKTYLKLLDTKKALEKRRRKALAEVD